MRKRRATFVAAPATRRVTRFTALAAIAVASWSGSAAAATCYRYGETVTLTGGHYAQAAPPADGVVRRPITDAGRLADLLLLDVPLCVERDVISAGVDAAMSVQLNCPAIDARDGDIVSVTGRLLGAHTGNGHTPVLLSCRY